MVHGALHSPPCKGITLDSNHSPLRLELTPLLNASIDTAAVKLKTAKSRKILFPGQFAGFPSNQSRRRYRVQFGKAGIRVSSQPRSNWFSIDEYFALERASDRRFEYREGEIVCMSGGSREHAAISRNVIRHLSNKLGRRCEAYGSDLAVCVPEGLRIVMPMLRWFAGNHVSGTSMDSTRWRIPCSSLKCSHRRRRISIEARNSKSTSRSRNFESIF